jgi:hypothetical protein
MYRWNKTVVKQKKLMAIILKGDSLTAYEAAVEDLTVDPDDDTQVIPLTEDHVSKKRCVLSLKLFSLLVLSKLRNSGCQGI